MITANVVIKPIVASPKVLSFTWGNRRIYFFTLWKVRVPEKQAPARVLQDALNLPGKTTFSPSETKLGYRFPPGLKENETFWFFLPFMAVT